MDKVLVFWMRVSGVRIAKSREILEMVKLKSVMVEILGKPALNWKLGGIGEV